MRAQPSTPSGLSSLPLENPTVQNALAVLLEGYYYAQDLGDSPWEFAVDLPTLLAVGCTPNMLRWLVRRGYVDQAGQPDLGAGGKGEGRTEADRAPVEAARFVLTELGTTVARRLPSSQLAGVLAPGGSRMGAAERELPVWDSKRGELRFREQLVRRFRNTASHQRAVLDAFQQQGWPDRLPTSLLGPADLQTNRKRWLHDTIKNLNRRHRRQCLRFFGVGSGVVGWKRLS